MAEAKELERIAMLYIDALLTADDSKVPLAPDMKRAHLMVLPGAPYVWQMTEGADTVRADIRREKLTARKDLRVTVDPERSTVVVLWESGMEFDDARAITIMDRFVIRDGLIAELEIISIPQGQPFERVPYAGWPGG
ncbi:MAG: hypothetical protein JWM91_4424 [Rhodospirillales bacterium]|nr:hypothetical protein [Rhodospirillales bacterium]